LRDDDRPASRPYRTCREAGEPHRPARRAAASDGEGYAHHGRLRRRAAGDQRRALRRLARAEFRLLCDIARRLVVGGERALSVGCARSAERARRIWEASMPQQRTDGDEAFRLDGLVLVRGKRSETRLRVLELADATWLELPVIVLRGAKPGPVFYLGAAFHGD